MTRFITLVVGVLLACLLAAGWRANLPTEGPGPENIRWPEGHQVSVSGSLALRAFRSSWAVRDLGVVKVANIVLADQRFAAIGMPDGRWWIVNNKQ